MSRSLLAAALILLSCFSAWAQLSANFSADTTRGCSPVTVQFSDQSSGLISDYYWTFGNGNTSNLKNPSAIFYKLTIYNRWGEKLYESNSIYDNWDGSYEGKIVENEAYVYIIETMGIDLIKRNYKGTVTVVR